MSAVFSFNVGDSTRKLVLLGLANHAHKDGTCAYAGAKLLAEYANCSVRTVQRHIAVLLEEGWIREGDQTVIDPRIPERYRPISYELALNPEDRKAWKADREPGRRDQFAEHGQTGGTKAAENKRGANLSPLTDAPLDASDEPVDNRGANLSPLPDEPEIGSGVTPVTPRGDTGDASGVTRVSPKPSIEPSKEPTTPAADASGGPDSSVISNDEGQADGTLALDGIVVEGKVETQREQAYRIVRAYLDWFEAKTGAPVVGKTRVVEALRKSYVEVALDGGATEDQIKTALANSGSEQPPMPHFRRLLREAMGGHNLATVSQFPDRQGPAAYTDKVWAEKAAIEGDRTETPEEIQARLDREFGSTGTEQ